MTVTQGDFIAMIDTLTELANASDSLSVDEALAAMEALRNLQSEARRCAAMVETQAKVHLEDGSRQIGGRLYALARAGKWRYRHDEIAKRVIDLAARRPIDRLTGELGPEPSATEAARRATALMLGLYCAPSDEPTATGLKELGYTTSSPGRGAADWENTGKKIKIIDLEASEGA